MPKLAGDTAPQSVAPALASAAPVALAVLALLVQLTIYDRNFVSMDEGHLALTASRLLDGDLLYRDIHTGIFPGVYALTAGLFALFGEEILVTRIAEMVVNTASVLLLWFIGQRVVPRRWAILPPFSYLGLVLIGFPVLTMFNYSSLAGALALGALLSTLRYIDGGRRIDGVAIGVLVGLCVFTKQNYGGLAAIAIATAILATRRSAGFRERSLVTTFGPIVLSGAAFLAIAIGALGATGTLGAWVDSTLLSLVGSQLEDFNNPIPPIFGPHPDGDIRFIYLYIPSALFDYLVRGDTFLGLPIDARLISSSIRFAYGLPLLALMAAPIALALRGFAQQPTRQPEFRSDVVVVIFAVAFFFGIFPSAVFSHLIYVMAPILLLFAMLGSWIEESIARLLPASARLVYPASAITVVLLVAGCATIPAHIRATYSHASMLPHVGVKVAEDQAALHSQALRFIEECARPDAPIFTLPILPVLYLSSARPNPVKWDLLIPGAIDEQAIVSTLENEHVECIVRQRDMNPEFRRLEDLYPTLDRYIAQNYRKGRELRAGQQLWYGLRRTAPFRTTGGAARQ